MTFVVESGMRMPFKRANFGIWPGLDLVLLWSSCKNQDCCNSDFRSSRIGKFGEAQESRALSLQSNE